MRSSLAVRAGGGRRDAIPPCRRSTTPAPVVSRAASSHYFKGDLELSLRPCAIEAAILKSRHAAATMRVSLATLALAAVVQTAAFAPGPALRPTAHPALQVGYLPAMAAASATVPQPAPSCAFSDTTLARSAREGGTSGEVVVHARPCMAWCSCGGACLRLSRAAAPCFLMTLCLRTGRFGQAVMPLRGQSATAVSMAATPKGLKTSCKKLVATAAMSFCL
jgi:hypothetical protein